MRQSCGSNCGCHGGCRHKRKTPQYNNKHGNPTILINLPFGEGEPARRFGVEQAHPVIKSNGHAVHAVMAAEVYFEPIFRRPEIAGWYLIDAEEFNVPRFCFYYHRQSRDTIMSCRGTTDAVDIIEDWKLATYGACMYDRAQEAHTLLTSFSKNFPKHRVLNVTGHSLGGAAARCLSQSRSGIKAIIFNPAAPPTAPVSGADNSLTYHIVMDVVSSWCGPDSQVIRIDQGDRIRVAPYPSIVLLAPLAAAIYATSAIVEELGQIVPSHYMDRFFTNNGAQAPSGVENHLWQDWWLGHPPVVRLVFGLLVFGTTLGINKARQWTLPPIP